MESLKRRWPDLGKVGRTKKSGGGKMRKREVMGEMSMKKRTEGTETHTWAATRPREEGGGDEGALPCHTKNGQTAT